MWLMGGPSPNHYVDITGVFDRKLAALRAYESQTSHRSGWKRKCASGSHPTTRRQDYRPTVSSRPFRWSASHSVMPGAVHGPTGFECLVGILDEFGRRLAPARANDFNEASNLVKGSPGPKPTHLFKCLLTDRTRALKVALLGVGAGQDGVALDTSPQMGRSAELDRQDRELLSLAGRLRSRKERARWPVSPPSSKSTHGGSSDGLDRSKARSASANARKHGEASSRAAWAQASIAASIAAVVGVTAPWVPARAAQAKSSPCRTSPRCSAWWLIAARMRPPNARSLAACAIRSAWAM